MTDTPQPLVEVRDLRVEFATERGTVRAVNGMNFSLQPGEVLGIVGESGSGKSVTNLALMGLLPPDLATVRADAMRFDGIDLRTQSQAQLRTLRGNRMAMIFQDPMTSLNPFLRIERQLTEVLELHTNLDAKARRHRAIESLERVGIPDAAKRIRAYPHQFSGGMRQRVMVAMALLCRPRLLIADEPTTALDVTVQAQILDLIRELTATEGTSVILVTHDLGVVAGLADSIVVMYAGRAMEQASAEQLFDSPTHPYTRGLLACLPGTRADRRQDLYTIPGLPPDMSQPPSGCPFHPRCAAVQAVCKDEDPSNLTIDTGHFSRCHFRNGGRDE